MHTQAIQTKFIPATNHQPSRIKATCARGSITLGYHSIIAAGGSSAHEDGLHVAVAKALCDKFIQDDAVAGGHGGSAQGNPWSRKFATGCLKVGVYVHVFI